MANTKKEIAPALAQNLKVLRMYRKLSQQGLADILNIKRSRLNAWENKMSEPSVQHILQLADFFRVSTDRLLRQNMSTLTRYELTRIEQGYDLDLRGRHLRILATTVDENNNEQIELVPEKAKAGYTSGFSDPEFIKELPRLGLPFLDQEKKYRTFPISGDSMPPVGDGSFVVGEYVEDWSTIKSGTPSIVITQDEGIVFKLVHNWLEEKGCLQLSSTNPSYQPYEVKGNEILELWKFVNYISPTLPEPNLEKELVVETLLALQRDVHELKNK